MKPEPETALDFIADGRLRRTLTLSRRGNLRARAVVRDVFTPTLAALLDPPLKPSAKRRP